MANEEHLKIFLKGVAAWGSWRIENPRITPDLREAALTAAELVGTKLTGIWDSDRAGAKLAGANLKDVNFRDADLTGANLKDADFRNADLRHAKLMGANLAGANFRNANLTGADLTGANLTGANLGYTEGLTQDQINTIRFHTDSPPHAVGRARASRYRGRRGRRCRGSGDGTGCCQRYRGGTWSV